MKNLAKSSVIDVSSDGSYELYRFDMFGAGVKVVMLRVGEVLVAFQSVKEVRQLSTAATLWWDASMPTHCYKLPIRVIEGEVRPISTRFYTLEGLKKSQETARKNKDKSQKLIEWLELMQSKNVYQLRREADRVYPDCRFSPRTLALMYPDDIPEDYDVTPSEPLPTGLQVVDSEDDYYNHLEERFLSVEEGGAKSQATVQIDQAAVSDFVAEDKATQLISILLEAGGGDIASALTQVLRGVLDIRDVVHDNVSATRREAESLRTLYEHEVKVMRDNYHDINTELLSTASELEQLKEENRHLKRQLKHYTRVNQSQAESHTDTQKRLINEVQELKARNSALEEENKSWSKRARRWGKKLLELNPKQKHWDTQLVDVVNGNL